MNIEARKLRIIEAFSSLKDIKKISQIESLIFPQSSLQNRQSMLKDLLGSWSEEEAEDIEKIIDDGCGKIDESEW